MVARSTSGQIFSDRLNLTQTNDGFDLIVSTSRAAFDHIDGYRPSSIAISPWCANPNKVKLKSVEWAVAGRRYNPSLFAEGHLGVVELYNAKTNQRIWHRQIPLDCSGMFLLTLDIILYLR